MDMHVNIHVDEDLHIDVDTHSMLAIQINGRNQRVNTSRGSSHSGGCYGCNPGTLYSKQPRQHPS